MPEAAFPFGDVNESLRVDFLFGVFLPEPPRVRVTVKGKVEPTHWAFKVQIVPTLWPPVFG